MAKRRMRGVVVADTRTRAEVVAYARGVMAANRAAGRSTYEGLDSHEIGQVSWALMFGDNDEAFPSAGEWSRIVD
jgi:hypothetical protein